jgi:DNA-binding XRE family transcriptional regulator
MKMSRAGVPIEEIKKKLMLDEEFKEEYDKLQPRYEIISQIIEARKENNMTQSDLAKMVGTQKSNISRLESGNYNPSLDLLIKVANCLGKKLEIKIS